jgi:hypothetical protein
VQAVGVLGVLRLLQMVMWEWEGLTEARRGFDYARDQVGKFV